MRVIGGRYLLREVIGRGGMAQVWRADDQTLRREVAVKLLAPSLRGDGHSWTRLTAEALSAARFTHPNIATVLDYGEDHDGADCRPYIVMELVRGDTLAARLEAGPLSWYETARVCSGVAEALAHVHAHGLVHRDVKPANIILTDGGPKVIDFGVAATAGLGLSTANELVWGTPAYMAPEQMEGSPASPTDDLYALGVLIYVCLTGRRPWPETGYFSLVGSRRRAPSPDLPSIPGLPPAVEQMYRSCVARRPRDRTDAEEVSRRLRVAAGLPARTRTVRIRSAARMALAAKPDATARRRPRRPTDHLRHHQSSTPVAVAGTAAVIALTALAISLQSGPATDATVDIGTGAGDRITSKTKPPASQHPTVTTSANPTADPAGTAEPAAVRSPSGGRPSMSSAPSEAGALWSAST